MKIFIKRFPHWVACFVSIFVVGVYWGLIASDRYISEANVVLESPQIASPTLDFQTLLSGSGSGNSSDMLLLRDYLLSVDMLKKIDTEFAFRGHYANSDIDFISSLASTDVPIEELHAYYLKQISVELDDYAHVLRIKVSAFSPEMAQKMAFFLLKSGEQHMNDMGQRLASEQVAFLEKQVSQLNDIFHASRQDILTYQNEKGLISPSGTLENINTVVASLSAKLATLRAQRIAEMSYQSKKSAEVRRLDAEIAALSEQIEIERSRMAQSSGLALNVLSAEYQTLELKMDFALQSYSGALAALEGTRIEAARKLKQVSILQNPTFPEYSVEPRRFYNIIVFMIISIFLTLIFQMLLLIVKDHRD
ncbi:MAG: hypothetical protein ACW7DS_14015 [Paraglaciecola chathamensis]